MTMPERNYYRRNVATVEMNDSAVDVADTLEFHAIGSVVVVDGDDRPQGIITDRDLTCRVIAKGLDPEAVRASEIMSQPLVTADAKEPLDKITARMREAHVRRVPVVRDGKLAGIVTVDDLLFRFAGEFEDLTEAVRATMQTSRKRGKREQRRDDWEEKLFDARSAVERAGREAADFLAREFDSVRDRLGRKRGS
jgi:CBS domain-containing protein